MMKCCMCGVNVSSLSLPAIYTNALYVEHVDGMYGPADNYHAHDTIT
jgi:hypothetical protein